MSDLVRRVIEYLEKKEYKYLNFLHASRFGNFIAVLNPENRKVAVKIVKYENISPIEDKYCTSLHHQYLHEVQDIFTIEELRVKIYIYPLITKTLEDIIHSETFRKDPNSYRRIQKWLFQILCGLEHLHIQGLSHLNVRPENIYISEEDDAILTDYSTLNYSNIDVNR